MNREESDLLNPDEYEDVYLEDRLERPGRETVWAFRCVSKIRPDVDDVRILVEGHFPNRNDPKRTNIRFVTEGDEPEHGAPISDRFWFSLLAANLGPAIADAIRVSSEGGAV